MVGKAPVGDMPNVPGLLNLKEVFRMKHAATALAVAILALSATPVLAETQVERFLPMRRQWLCRMMHTPRRHLL
jgi:hypothetical protein